MPNTNPGTKVNSPTPRNIHTIAVKANTPISTTSLELNDWRTVNPRKFSKYFMLHDGSARLLKLSRNLDVA
jgi:hypothetical protein